MPIDLSLLPPPEIIEALNFEATLEAQMTDVASRFADSGVDYDVGPLETSPVKIVLESSAYRELLLRAHINDAVRANLLAFAKGSDLDHLGAFHGVARMVGEDDARFAARIILKNEDRNSGGTAPRIEYLAMTADIRVKDVVAYTVGRSPVIHLPILATDNDGVADEALLAVVDSAVNSAANRMINDTIEPAAAVQNVVNISANIWLLPSAALSDIDTIEPALRAAWASDGRLGRDLTPSWIAAKLQRAGVQRAENILPAGGAVAPFNQAVAIGEITLTFAGRAY